MAYLVPRKRKGSLQEVSVLPVVLDDRAQVNAGLLKGVNDSTVKSAYIIITLAHIFKDQSHTLSLHWHTYLKIKVIHYHYIGTHI